MHPKMYYYLWIDISDVGGGGSLGRQTNHVDCFSNEWLLNKPMFSFFSGSGHSLNVYYYYDNYVININKIYP